MVKSTFKSSIWKNILSILPFILFVEFALIGILASPFPESTRSALIAVALLFPLLMVPVVLFFRIKIEITDEEIRFSRFGTVYRRLPIKTNAFSAYVQRVTYQFIIPINYRYLRIVDSKGRIKNYQCFGFSKTTYERLIGEVQTLEAMKRSTALNSYSSNPTEAGPSGATGGNLEPELPFGGVQLTFPKEMFVKLLFKNFILSALLTAVVMIACALAFAYGLLSNVPMSGKLLNALSAPAGILLLIIAVVVFLMWLFYRRKAQKVPETIRITDTAIRIDDRVFSLGEISGIKMTPDKYLVMNNYYNLRNYRKLRIETTGKSHEYILGHISDIKRCYSYPEYSALRRSVDAFLHQVGKAVVMITF